MASETTRPSRSNGGNGGGGIAGGVRLAFGAVPTESRFVVVLLRGGMDGLAAVALYGDRAYPSQRGDLAMAQPGQEDGLVDLDGFFGLHPALINGTKGTDHGTGSLALLLGGAIAGGRIVTPWPGLRRSDLYDGHDYRSARVVKGVLHDHLGIAERRLADDVFPASAAVKPLRGLVRA